MPLSFNPRKILEQAKQFREQTLIGFEAPKTAQAQENDLLQSPRTREEEPSRSVDPFEMSNSPLMAMINKIRQGGTNTIKHQRPSPRYNPKHVKEMAATIFGEATSNKEEMRAMIDTVLNRRNQLGIDIKSVLIQKDGYGEPMYRAYGGKEYQKYVSGKLDRPGEPEKKKILDELIQELQEGNWKPSKFTNFEKLESEGRTKIGEHYFWTQFQGNRIRHKR
jgi:hypothetical protein